MSWHTGANWNPDGVPGAADDVIIDVKGTAITVTFSTGTATINSLTLEENLNLMGGTLNIAADSVVNGTLTLNGSLDGDGDLTINGALIWSAGNDLFISGAGALVVNSAATLSKTGNARLQRHVDNHGTVTSTSSWFMTGVVFQNGGNFVWDVSSGAATFSTVSPGAAFNNLGSFVKLGSGGAEFTANAGGQVPFNNAGLLDLQDGSLTIGKGMHFGAFQIVNPTSTLAFGRYGNMLSSRSTVTGDGRMFVDVAGTVSEDFVCDGSIDLQGDLQIYRGTPTFNGPVSVRGVLRLGFQCCENYQATFNGAVDLLPTGVIATVGSGTTHFNGPSIDLAGSAGSNATLSFVNDAVITRGFSWNGAVFLGPGHLIVAADSHLDLLSLNGQPLQIEIENHGTLDLHSGGFGISDTGGIVNSGFMTASIASPGSTGAIVGAIGNRQTPEIINLGVFSKAGLGRLEIGSTQAPLTLTNQGELQLVAGSLEFRQSMTNEGSVDVAVGAFLQFTASSVHSPDSTLNVQGEIWFAGQSVFGTHDLMGQTAIDGAMRVERAQVILRGPIAPATSIKVADFGTLRTEVNQDWVAGLELIGGNGGTLTGAGDVVLGGTSIFRGTMSGEGNTVIAAGATLTTVGTGGGSPRLERTLENNGTFTIADVSRMDFADGTLINNSVLNANVSSFTFRGVGGSNAIVNASSLNKNINGIATLANAGGPVTLVNDGTVNVNQGTLQLDCGGSGVGAIVVDLGATLRINSNCAGGSAVIDGVLWLSPQKRLTLAGAYAQNATGRLKATVISPLQALVTSAGAMTLDGTLELLMTPSPDAATTVPVLATASPPVAGVFVSRVLQPQGSLVYQPDRVDWVAYRAGDANGDNIVNIDDLLLLVGSWGACPSALDCTADMNTDGVIDINDLLIVIMHWDQR